MSRPVLGVVSRAPFALLYPDPKLPRYAALVDVILKLAKTPIVGAEVRLSAR
jgi:hypothetical protein